MKQAYRQGRIDSSERSYLHKKHVKTEKQQKLYKKNRSWMKIRQDWKTFSKYHDSVNDMAWNLQPNPNQNNLKHCWNLELTFQPLVYV